MPRPLWRGNHPPMSAFTSIHVTGTDWAFPIDEASDACVSGFEEQFKQYGLAVSAMPTAFQPVTIVRDMLVMFILSVLSTLYPILKINRYRPVEAMRHV